MSDQSKAVFLSYASQDADAAKTICDALREDGIEVWFDQSELRGGDSWDAKIRKQIKECTLFVAIISTNTQSRAEGYFRLEWHLAEQRSHLIARGRPFIVPVTIDATRDSDALVPDAFLAVQWMRLPEGNPDAAFAERLKTLLGGEPVGAASRRDAAQHSAHEESRHEAAPTRKGFPFAWLAGAAVVIAGIAAFFFIRPPAVVATAVPASPPGQPALSEADKLVARANAILDGSALSPEQIGTANDILIQATEHDPSNAAAWTAAARADRMMIHPYGYDRSEERRQRAMSRASRALNLAPDSFETRVEHTAVMAHASGNPDFAREAEESFRRMIKERPENPALQIHLAEVLREQRRFEEAAAVFEKIEEFELAAWSWYQAGQNVAAYDQVKRAVIAKRTTSALNLKGLIESVWFQDLAAAQATNAEFRPSELREELSAATATRLAFLRREPERMLQIVNALSHDFMDSHAFVGPRQYWTGWAHHLAGRGERAAIEWRKALPILLAERAKAPERVVLFDREAEIHALLGEREEAARLLTTAQRIANEAPDVVNFRNHQVHLALDHREQVLAWLTSFLREKPVWNWYDTHALARFSPVWDGLRRDSRFEALLRETMPADAKPFEVQVSPTPAASGEVVPPKSIAVLPFENRSRNEDDVFFTDGIHDDLLTQISRIKDIKSISRTSVMTYRGSAKKLRAIAGELGVATVLEGGVQRAGNQVRINVQLIDAATDAHLWAETYTRALTTENVFAIQSEIASAIASALKAVLTPEEKRQLEELPTQNLAALEAFFKAKSNDGSSAKTAEAISHLQRAISLDPDFAEAHALLADQILRQVWTDGLRPADQVAKAQPHVERALALAPQSSNAYAALGHLRNRQRRTNDAVAALRHAIQLNANNAAAYALLGYVQLWSRRDSGAAVESYRKALELDPLSPLTRQQTAEALSVDGRFDEAKAELEGLLQADPGYVEGVRNYGELQEYAYYRFDEAIKAYRRVVALDPRNPNFLTKLAMAHYQLGDMVAAKFWIEYALAVASQSRETGFLKGVLSLIGGDRDAAMAQFRTVSDDATFSGNARQFLFKAALDDGRPETATAALATLPPQSVAITQGNIRIECIRMCLLTVAGRRTEADELGERILAAMPQLARIGMRGYYADDVLVHLARNDRDRALAALQELSKAGACSTTFGGGAPFRVLQDIPEFQALMKINAARLAEQRSNVERWEAAGELAPIPSLPTSSR